MAQQQQWQQQQQQQWQQRQQQQWQQQQQGDATAREASLNAALSNLMRTLAACSTEQAAPGGNGGNGDSGGNGGSGGNAGGTAGFGPPPPPFGITPGPCAEFGPLGPVGTTPGAFAPARVPFGGPFEGPFEAADGIRVLPHSEGGCVSLLGKGIFTEPGMQPMQCNVDQGGPFRGPFGAAVEPLAAAASQGGCVMLVANGVFTKPGVRPRQDYVDRVSTLFQVSKALHLRKSCPLAGHKSYATSLQAMFCKRHSCGLPLLTGTFPLSTLAFHLWNDWNDGPASPLHPHFCGTHSQATSQQACSAGDINTWVKQQTKVTANGEDKRLIKVK